MKIKEWVRNKLKRFLEVDSLENKYSDLLQAFLDLSDHCDKMENLNKEIINKNAYILKQFNISADIYTHEPISWAVISIHGKPEYVKFISLSNRDMREIHNFLKMFEGTNRTIDSPVPYLKF